VHGRQGQPGVGPLAGLQDQPHVLQVLVQSGLRSKIAVQHLLALGVHGLRVSRARAKDGQRRDAI
jgi:hypothetical protein